MRIDLLGSTPIAETLASGAAAKAGPTQQQPGVAVAQAVPQDTTSFSAGAADPSSLTTQALASADSRAVKVEALRQAVVNAEFTLDPALIADAMISSAE